MKRSLTIAVLALAVLSLGSDSRPIPAEESARYARLRSILDVELADPAKVLSSLEEAVKIYADDGDVWWRLAKARLKAQRYDDAIDAYRRALRLGAFGNKFRANALYDEACAYALKGDKKQSFALLRQSLSAGFRDLEHLRHDPDLASLHTDRTWEELAATRDVSKMTRDQGWRYDLWLLHREVSRIHLNPYTKYTKAEQEAWVRKLDRDIPRMSDGQIIVAFMKYMRRINDGHTNIRPPNALRLPALPIQVYWYREGLIIHSAMPGSKDLLGAEVVKVAGKPVQEVVRVLDDAISRDNDQGVLSAVGRLLTIPMLLNGIGVTPSAQEAVLELRMPDGSTRTVTLRAGPPAAPESWVPARDPDPAKTPLYLAHREKPYWFEPVPALNAVYLQYNSVRNDPAENTERFMRRVIAYIEANNVERLIVDARWNGGGNSFLNRPIVNGIIGCSKVNKPGSLFVITGRQTFSAAQNFVTDLGRALDPIYVGEPTGSSPNFVGESVRFTLPYSKMEGSVSDLYWQRSWPMDHRAWIAPDLPAEPSFELYKANRDPAMEAIEAYVRSQAKAGTP